MNPIVFHVASGHAFFTGIALVIGGLRSFQRMARLFFRRLTVITFVAGVIAIAIASTAISYWYYAVAACTTFVWITSYFHVSWRPWTARAMIVVWTVAGLLEIRYHITPSLRPIADRTVTVIGDSVTAGVGGNETSETWPAILAREHNLEVQDISHVGETAASAYKRASSQQILGAVVVVEIGGNDILGSTTPSQFAVDLDALLGYVAVSDRQVIMLELPLPPFYLEYGRIQRAVAARHNVRLIPKRLFLSIIADRESTLDTIHLTQTGHQRMADAVWRLVAHAFDL